jgi:hypothetical protein
VVVEKFSAPKWRFAGKFQLVPGVVGRFGWIGRYPWRPGLVAWWATFDGDAPRREELAGTLQGWFGKWLESLRNKQRSRPSGFPKSRDR